MDTSTSSPLRAGQSGSTDDEAGPAHQNTGPGKQNRCRLVVGVGCRSGASVDEVCALVLATLAEAALEVDDVVALCTHQRRLREPAVLEVAATWGVDVVGYSSEQLARYPTPTPSDVVASQLGTPSVCEAAVLAYGAQLLLPKRTSTSATCAVGYLRA